MKDITVRKLIEKKKNLERSILEGLSIILNDFKSETGLAVQSLSTHFIETTQIDAKLLRDFQLTDVKVNIQLDGLE